MTTKHTPGPWHVEQWDYSHASPPRKELNVQTATHLLATVAWDQGLDNPYTIANEEAQANARLIAAAPDLLAALEQIANMRTMPDHGANMITLAAAHQLARAAIAKAKG